MRKSTGRAMFEAMMLLTAQQSALANPRAPVAKPRELTAEERAARARKANIAAWQALNERYRREAGTRKTY